MGAITSRGRTGYTQVPNWRWEDESLDSYELRIAGWLTSHINGWVEDHVSRNIIAARARVSQGKTTLALQKLAQLGIVSIADSDGKGRRMTIEVDLDRWSCGDHPTGHDVTTNWSPGDHRGEQLEEQVSKPLSSPDDDGQFDEWWKLYPKKAGKIAARREFSKALKNATTEELFDGLARWVTHWRIEKTARTFIPDPERWLRKGRWADELGATPPVDLEPGPPIALDIFKAWTDMKAWTAYKRPELIPHAREIMEAFVVMRRWHYSLGETMIRFALGIKHPDITQCWDPKWLGSDQLRTPRFNEMPVEHWETWRSSRATLTECLDWAFQNGRWAQ